ncbi:MAG: 3-isopropylmalate dehydrogenase [Firmicutes bacterium]|nr:3-isopropylmalate dehydrogenase [Alicyclobacillaceae bacterium]MCL6497561.1 3-isopropylmalate dehydrogenase [Bacillota bacterium]
METRRLLVLPGDGIGPEVIGAALAVLEAVSHRRGFAYTIDEGLLGGAAIDATGDPYPPETRRKVEQHQAVLLGAVGGPKWDDRPRRPEAGLLELRQHMGVYANLRPFEVWPGLEHLSPLRTQGFRGLIVRELTGGIYFGTPRGRREVDGEWEGFDTMRYRQSEIRRLARVGFEWARRQNTPLVSIDKANVLETSRVWRETVTALGREEYPDVPLVHRYVDAAAMEMVLHPERYAVAITENLFGDILSDLAGGLVGSLGLLASLSVSGEVGSRGLYEPVHGSAPDIAGKGIANPVGAILSLAWLMGWTWADAESQALVTQAVAETIRAGELTPDLGGSLSTEAFTRRVIERLG